MNRFGDGEEDLAHLFNGIVEQSVAGIYLIQDGIMRYVNRSYAAFFGTTPERFIGRRLSDVAPAAQREEMLALYERRIEGGDPDLHYNIHTSTPVSDERIIQIHGRRVEYRGRPAVVGIGIDVTEQEISRRELVESRAQLRMMAEAVESAQDRERAQISLEIHDDIGGLLTATKFDISRLRKRLDNPELVAACRTVDDIKDLVEGISELTQETIDVARQISEELRTPIVDHLGLVAAIKDHAERFSKRFGIRCTVEVPDNPLLADADTELNLFRIVQESLTNVVRHSGASACTISLHVDTTSTTLVVEDDGRGIDLERVDDRKRDRAGIGLVGMGERTRRIGGKIEIGNAEAGGGRIRVTVPASQNRN